MKNIKIVMLSAIVLSVASGLEAAIVGKFSSYQSTPLPSATSGYDGTVASMSIAAGSGIVWKANNLYNRIYGPCTDANCPYTITFNGRSNICPAGTGTRMVVIGGWAGAGYYCLLGTPSNPVSTTTLAFPGLVGIKK